MYTLGTENGGFQRKQSEFCSKTFYVTFFPSYFFFDFIQNQNLINLYIPKIMFKESEFTISAGGLCIIRQNKLTLQFGNC